MMYLATRNVQMVYRDAAGKQQLATIVSGALAPVEVTAEQAAPFLARGFLRELTDEQAARVARGPRPAGLDEQSALSFFHAAG